MKLYIFTLGPNGPVKIGVTKNVSKRRSQLQTGNPQYIGEWLEYEIDEPEARECEQRLLEELAPWRLTGEWLDLGEEFISEYIPDFFKSHGVEPAAP